MTLRIFVEIDEDEATVALHGRLTVDEVAEVERVAVAQEKRLKLDLTHLTGVDADGLAALRRLRDGGAKVTEASPFIRMMLERTEATEAARAGEPERKAVE